MGDVSTDFDWPTLAALAVSGPVTKAGVEKCTAVSKQTGKRCGRWPAPGTKVCKVHGGGAPQVKAKAEKRLQEQKAQVKAARLVGKLTSEDITELSDPFGALETVIAHQHAVAIRMLKILDAIPDNALRYEGKYGEQVRGELAACQRALADLRASSESALKIGLAERRAAISAERLAHEERAFALALQAAEIPPDKQDLARKVLARELMRGIVVKGEI